jgi:hypothetical protein
MRLTRCGLGESHTLKFPCEGINFGGAGIFLQTILLTLPLTSGKLLKKSLRFFNVENEEGFSSMGIYVLLSFLRQSIVESLVEFPIFHAGGWEIYHETMIALPGLGESLVLGPLRLLFLLTCQGRNLRSLVNINLDINLRNEW